MTELLQAICCCEPATGCYYIAALCPCSPQVPEVAVPCSVIDLEQDPATPIVFFWNGGCYSVSNASPKEIETTLEVVNLGGFVDILEHCEECCCKPLIEGTPLKVSLQWWCGLKRIIWSGACPGEPPDPSCFANADDWGPINEFNCCQVSGISLASVAIDFDASIDGAQEIPMTIWTPTVIKWQGYCGVRLGIGEQHSQLLPPKCPGGIQTIQEWGGTVPGPNVQRLVTVEYFKSGAPTVVFSINGVGEEQDLQLAFQHSIPDGECVGARYGFDCGIGANLLCNSPNETFTVTDLSGNIGSCCSTFQQGTTKTTMTHNMMLEVRT